MFAKKPPPEPKLPGVPPILRLSGPAAPAASVIDAPLQNPPPIALPEPMDVVAEVAPTDRIAHAILAQAFREGADEIALTPDGKALVVEYLVAGEWRETMSIPLHVAPGLGAAFKTLAGLPVWEHRMMLHGLIVVQYGAADYDVHLSITPARHGENVALRMEAV